MKKIMLTCLMMAAIIACNNDTGSGKNAIGAGKDLSDDPVYKEGLTLVVKNNCITCHKVDEKFTGPSYREVAEKYGSAGKEVIPALATKIIEGGSGVWGPVPMIPHPDVSEADAEKMVKYILLLKK